MFTTSREFVAVFRLLHIPMQDRLYHDPRGVPGASDRLVLRAFALVVAPCPSNIWWTLAQDWPIWRSPEFTRLFDPDCSGKRLTVKRNAYVARNIRERNWHMPSPSVKVSEPRRRWLVVPALPRKTFVRRFPMDKTTSFCVYWLYDDNCICLERHGYVGISKNYLHRVGQHRSARRFPWNSQVIFRGTQAECKRLENKLRPKRYIGWNIAVGGGKTRLGIFDSLTTRQMKSIARQRFLSSPQAKEILRIAGEKNSVIIKGRLITWGDKIAKTLTGHVRTIASRAKQSASVKGRPKSAKWRDKASAIAESRYAEREPRSPTHERGRLAKNAKRAARRAAGLPRLY